MVKLLTESNLTIFCKHFNLFQVKKGIKSAYFGIKLAFFSVCFLKWNKNAYISNVIYFLTHKIAIIFFMSFKAF